MKSHYNAPVVEVSGILSGSLLCASGDNEDFGHKNGTYDILEPFENRYFAR